MIGVFDSGEGGENALRHIKRLAPSADVTLLADRKNAPYGTKCQDELIRLTEAGISRLIEAGCNRVLIACCTASTVHPLISSELSGVSLPIIEPTAREAKRISRNGRIALLATEATVRSHLFASMLGNSCVAEIAASPLVAAIERGERDGRITDTLGRYLDTLLTEAAGANADTLILGCTHFACLKGEIEARLKKISKKKIYTVDSSELGARHILDIWPRSRAGEGRLQRI